ncbi:hypothetical protein COOONC_13299 [Cooperia oncophora]
MELTLLVAGHAQRQQQGKLTFQENVNRRVLLGWVRITGLENKQHWKYDKLLAHLANVITGYPSDGKPNAFTWPTAAGVSGGLEGMRVSIRFAIARISIVKSIS